MARPAQPASVEDLLLEADRTIAENAKGSAQKNEKLVSARDKVTLLPADQRSLEQADVRALNAALQAAHRSVRPAGDTVSQRMVYVCILLSMLLMFLVGSLSLVYNKGVALLAEIETLAAQQPDRHFGQLERQLLVAQVELFSGGEEQSPPATDSDTKDSTGQTKRPIDELARESSYLTLHELRDLNFKLKSLETRVGDFENLSDSPFPGVLKLETIVSAAVAGGRDFIGASKTADVMAGSATSETQGAGIKDVPKTPNTGSDTMNYFCQPHSVRNSGDGGSIEGGKATAESAPPANSQVLGMDMRRIVEQACKYSLNYVSMTVPSVDSWAVRIKDSIDPYAVWVLPCLYAALGSMIYYMRLILDTTQPNPPIYRIAHRMALAALAGMILAWFWGPTFGGNSEFKSVGFGLFTFAFIVGFSIDVFFALLDRMVFVSTNAISKLGVN